MRNIDEKKYEQYVKQLTPTHSLPLNMAKAFLTGGLICLLGQVIINISQSLGADTSDARTWCSVLLILLSVILTGLGIYPKIGKFGGAGSLVPITVFLTPWLHLPLSSGQKDRSSALDARSLALQDL